MASLIVLIVIAAVVLITLARASGSCPRRAPASWSGSAATTARSTPGWRWSCPYVDRVKPLIDLREQVVSFPPQPVITEDNLSIQIDTVIYFQVTDPKAATYEIADYIVAIEQLTVTTLRNVTGGMTLEDTLTSRDKINAALRMVLDEATGQVGHPREPRRAEGGRPARLDPGGDGEADARRARPARRDPHRRGRQAVADPHRRGREAVRDPARRGPARGADPPGRGPVEGDRDGLRRHPPRRRRPQAARLPVPAGAAADRPGRVEQGLDHPERGHPGARQPRLEAADGRRRSRRACRAGPAAPPQSSSRSGWRCRARRRRS